MKRILLLLGFFSLIGSAVSHSASVDTDVIVLRNVAKIMKLKPSQLKIELPFTKQTIPGDALDVVEIVMAVENELGIEIDDKELDEKVGASGVKDIAQKLTIRQFQEIVRKHYLNKKRPKQLFRPTP